MKLKIEIDLEQGDYPITEGALLDIKCLVGRRKIYGIVDNLCHVEAAQLTDANSKICGSVRVEK